MNDEKLYALLRKYWHHEEFRPMQKEIIDSVLAGRDTLALMPTGGGKSLTYQLPTLAREGLCIVVTPLIALMKDQVDNLCRRGIQAVAIHSGLSHSEIDRLLDNCVYGSIKFLYIAPERIGTELFLMRVAKMKLSLIAVDEAHCISQWGYDFRPSYLRIAELRRAHPEVPILALTASATELVTKDIMENLQFPAPNLLRSSFLRPNLSYSVRHTEDKQGQLLRLIRNVPGTGIVYVRKRESTEQLAEWLRSEGITAEAYHGGLAHAERSIRQEEWIQNRVRVMVATNAFGMGIDKSNVRFVVHYNMPRSMEAYYQEAGRAGRDGERAECILLYSGQDIITAKWMIEHNPPNEALSAAEQANVRRLDMNRLNSMIDYCTKDLCLRSYILRYFGGKTSDAGCGDCGHCCSGRYSGAGEAEAVQRKQRKNDVPAPKKSDAPKDGLLEQLKAVRMALAKAQRVPPYIICNDATLASMVRIRPQTRQGMLSVNGMGEVKTAKYGDAFLKVIKDYAVQEKRMRQQVAAIAREAQSAVNREKKSYQVPSVLPPYPSDEISRSAVRQPLPPPAVRVYEPPRSVPVIPPREPLENDDADIADAYLSGVSIQEMADELGVSPAVIRQRLAEMDLIF